MTSALLSQESRTKKTRGVPDGAVEEERDREGLKGPPVVSWCLPHRLLPLACFQRADKQILASYSVSLGYEAWSFPLHYASSERRVLRSFIRDSPLDLLRAMWASYLLLASLGAVLSGGLPFILH